MRLACSPFARAAPPARSRPHTHRHTTPAPEMTIGASTRVEPRGSLPRGVPKPRPPNPFHGRSARAPSLPPSPCCRCRAPQVGSHYRARPNSAGRGHSAARDSTASRRRPLPPDRIRVPARPQERERETERAKEKDAHFYTLPRPPASRPPVLQAAPVVRKRPPVVPHVVGESINRRCVHCLRCCPVGSRAGAGEAAARCEGPTIRRRCFLLSSRRCRRAGEWESDRRPDARAPDDQT